MCLLAQPVQLFATLWTAACQAPVSMGFPKHEYWSGLLFPPPGDLPHQGTELLTPVSPALAGSFFTSALPGKPQLGRIGLSKMPKVTFPRTEP